MKKEILKDIEGCYSSDLRKADAINNVAKAIVYFADIISATLLDPSRRV